MLVDLKSLSYWYSAEMFSLEGNEIFLLKRVTDPQTVTLNIVAEDYFENKRFTKIVETIDVDFSFVTPATLPVDGTYPAYSLEIMQVR